MNHMGHEITVEGGPFDSRAECERAEEAIRKRLAGLELPDLKITVFMPQDSDFVLVIGRLGRPGRRFVLGGELEDIPDRVVDVIMSPGFPG